MPVLSISFSHASYEAMIDASRLEGKTVPAYVRGVVERALGVLPNVARPNAGRVQVRENPTPLLAEVWRAQGWVECVDGKWRPADSVRAGQVKAQATAQGQANAPSQGSGPGANESAARSAPGPGANGPGAMRGALPEGWTVDEEGRWAPPGEEGGA